MFVCLLFVCLFLLPCLATFPFLNTCQGKSTEYFHSITSSSHFDSAKTSSVAQTDPRYAQTNLVMSLSNRDDGHKQINMRTNQSGSMDILTASVLYVIAPCAFPSPKDFTYLILKVKKSKTKNKRTKNPHEPERRGSDHISSNR